MITQPTSPAGSNNDAPPAMQKVFDGPRRAWVAPSVTVVDLAKVTFAESTTTTDSGFGS